MNALDLINELLYAGGADDVESLGLDDAKVKQLSNLTVKIGVQENYPITWLPERVVSPDQMIQALEEDARDDGEEFDAERDAPEGTDSTVWIAAPSQDYHSPYAPGGVFTS